MRFTARTAGLVVEELDGGVVIYDTRNDRAHYLEPATATVWRACATTRAFDELTASTGLERGACQAALDQLGAAGLLEVPGVSRRAVLGTAAKLGVAGAAAGPILSAVIPAAAAAASGPGGGGGGIVPCTEICEAGSTTLVSGTTPTSVQSAADPTAQTAVPVVPAPNGAYTGVIAGTSYVGPPDFGDAPPGDYTYVVGQSIHVPCSASTATLDLQFYSDNQGTAYLNGSRIAQNQPCGAGPDANGVEEFTGNPEEVTVSLTPGQTYTLSFVVNNCGTSNNPTALDYKAVATISC